MTRTELKDTLYTNMLYVYCLETDLIFETEACSSLSLIILSLRESVMNFNERNRNLYFSF